MSQTFKIDMSGASPFQVFANNGDVMFDARHASMMVEQSGVVGIPARNIQINPFGGTDAYAIIPYSRSRGAQVPNYTVIAYARANPVNLNDADYWVPRFTVNDHSGTFSTAVLGFFSQATPSRLLIGNFSPDQPIGGQPGAITAYYVIFGNSVG